MKKIQFITVLLILLVFTQLKASSLEIPSFLPQYFAPAFEINGRKLSFIKHSEKDGVEQYLYFTDDKSLVLLTENIKCERPRGAAIFNNIVGNLNDRMKSYKGEFIEITKRDMHAQIYEEGRERTLFVYVMPTAIQIWTYIAKSDEKYPVGPQFKIIRNFINKQRYNEAVSEGNVSMGFWGSEIYEYAGSLLHDGRKKEGLEVLEKLVATSPYHYNAHMDIIENTDDRKAAVNSSKVIMKGAEDPKLVTGAAKFLGTEVMTLDSLPLLSKDERGFQLILIPLEPCDVSLLEDVSKTYQKITNIPVKIRRIKEGWTWTVPDRISYQRIIQETLIKMKGEDINFKGWTKAKYINELKMSAESRDALDKYYINALISKVDKEEGQYFVDTYLDRFLNIIKKYRSNDYRTMYVGITGINIYSGDNNYIFSLHMNRNKSQASILSYYMMLASNLSEEYESRNRLIERIAKELVPASLKSLGIPRSTDPTCPYSYSSGVSRLDQKTLTLSEQVKNMIEEIRLQQINPLDARSSRR
jgi:predicted Zn-dependent protease